MRCYMNARCGVLNDGFLPSRQEDRQSDLQNEIQARSRAFDGVRKLPILGDHRGMNETEREAMLEALQALMDALENYEEFRELNTGLPDEYWHSMNKD